MKAAFLPSRHDLFSDRIIEDRGDGRDAANHGYQRDWINNAFATLHFWTIANLMSGYEVSQILIIFPKVLVVKALSTSSY